MADDTVPAGRQQLLSKHPFQQGEKAACPLFQPGESSNFLPGNSSNITTSATPAQQETDQHSLHLSERSIVSSSFFLLATMTLLTFM
jgi:hypothetical protein